MAEKEGVYAKGSFYVAVLGLILTYLIAAGQTGWWPFRGPAKAGNSTDTCVNPTIENRADSPDRLRPPRGLSVSWDRSPTHAGRVSATLHWENIDPRTSFGLIEVTGRYGNQDGNDIPYILDGRPLPTEGLCGHWLRRYNDVDDDERGVFFDGLWPFEPYCFAVNSSDPGGGVKSPYPSIQTPPVCETAPWSRTWGQPERT